ncbi:MAG: hypothetical protein CM1200mP16_06380 [Nitrospina sp.]|nr:MAG: hypothetical protein CM1200mP16_06380 [Nitrospina sp.]
MIPTNGKMPSAYCCNYFAFGIDEPETEEIRELAMEDAHENTSIYIYRQDWFIMIHNRCNFLMPDKNVLSMNTDLICAANTVQNPANILATITALQNTSRAMMIY